MLPSMAAKTSARRAQAAGHELDGRVCLVTGAGVRVGRAIAEELGRAGARVAVHYGRSGAGARATVAAITTAARATPGTRTAEPARAFAADLGQPGTARTLVAEVQAWAGRLDVLVCSAARFERRAFEDIDEAAWRDMLAVNLEAPFRLAQAAAPELRRRRGVIVNILDVAAFQAWRGYAHYAASKAGLAMLTRILALELAPRVRVCGVAPGTVAPAPDFPRAARARELGRVPLGRFGTPADVAGAVRYLCSAGYVTGSILTVDGGRSAGARTAP